MPDYTFSDRLKHAWNAFTSRDPTPTSPSVSYSSQSYRPDRYRYYRGSERSIITSIENRISIDVAQIKIKHVQLDDNERYLFDRDSGLNNILTLEANIDQTNRAFIHDLVYSMLDEGVVAVVPIDTSMNPNLTDSYDIKTMRIGTITQWYPQHVKVNIYNDKNGKHEEVTLPKKMVGIIENPLYSVMNEPNSTLQRLIRKLSLLDLIDEQSGAGKLDLIIQLPYVVKTEARKSQAEQRRKDIEMQLTGSKYGIAYTDGTERITQLNRPVENNLLKQIEYLTNTLYGQLGITEAVFKGEADEKTLLNYYNRTIEPILSAITTEFKRKFLTKTARSQHQSIEFFRDNFRLITASEMAELADKLTRNEIATSNEIRQLMGMKPSDDPKADELRNSNLYYNDQAQDPSMMEDPSMMSDPSMMEDPNAMAVEEEDPGQIPISMLMN